MRRAWLPLSAVILASLVMLIGTSAAAPSCSGCMVGGKCLPFGYRLVVSGTPSYCDIGGIQQQKASQSPCFDNYQCRTNACSAGRCIEVQGYQNMFVSIFCRIFNLFSESGYQACLLQNGIGTAVCGDGVCSASAGETCSSCQGDCGACPPVCGNGLCEGLEFLTCPQDCRGGTTPPRVDVSGTTVTLNGDNEFYKILPDNTITVYYGDGTSEIRTIYDTDGQGIISAKTIYVDSAFSRSISGAEFSLGCLSPLQNCGSECTYTPRDDNNCGSCGNKCPDGTRCSEGVCINNGNCADGMMDCGGFCANPSIDNGNCGSCGNACGPGESCWFGECSCDDTEKQYCYPDGCTNTKTDASNCGSCNNMCQQHLLCEEGQCQCPLKDPSSCDPENPPERLTDCGPNDGCVDTDTDSNNCGGCGIVCDSSVGEFCEDGSCVTVCESCEAGEACCTDPYSGVEFCVDTSSNPGNCGGCGQYCMEPYPSCSNGQCICGGTVCDGQCAYTDSDPMNCGSCGNDCNAYGSGTAICCDGSCLTPPEQPECPNPEDKPVWTTDTTECASGSGPLSASANSVTGNVIAATGYGTIHNPMCDGGCWACKHKAPCDDKTATACKDRVNVTGTQIWKGYTDPAGLAWAPKTPKNVFFGIGNFIGVVPDKKLMNIVDLRLGAQGNALAEEVKTALDVVREDKCGPECKQYDNLAVYAYTEYNYPPTDKCRVVAPSEERVVPGPPITSVGATNELALRNAAPKALKLAMSWGTSFAEEYKKQCSPENGCSAMLSYIRIDTLGNDKICSKPEKWSVTLQAIIRVDCIDLHKPGGFKKTWAKVVNNCFCALPS